jgi:hypothetical protein
LAQPSAGARGRAGRRPTWPATGGTAQGRRRGHGPTCQREGEGTTLGGGDGGQTSRSPTAVRSAAVLRRGPCSVTIEWWKGTGEGRGLRWWGQFGRRALGTAGPRRGGRRPRRWDRR